jgi:hypothetical protein
MKRIILLSLAVALAVTNTLAQAPAGMPTPRPPGFTYAQPETNLVHFDLDFRGGPPADLLLAIEKVSSVHVNAIIPPENENTIIPPFKMKQVTIPRLFEAIRAASQKTVSYRTGSSSWSQYQSAYGFQCNGPIGDESVWYFRVDKPNLPEEETPAPYRVCRFYQLGPYLDKFTVEDITTALKTAWDMLGNSPVLRNSNNPEIKYHKDTRLLIAVGEPEKLKLIDDVLKQLSVGVAGEGLGPVLK